MTRIDPQAYVANLDMKRPAHRAFVLACLQDVDRLRPEALQDGGDLRAIWLRQDPAPVAPAEPAKPATQEWRTAVQALNLSQPDAVSCQSACLAMATGNRDIPGIRRKLQAMGDPGSPGVMARYARSVPGVRYEYDGDACLEDVYGWLMAGELLITHGWFTSSGHVICLDGLMANPDGSKAISVKDPWSEFDARTWSYPYTSRFFDGYYGDRCIYAACVAGANVTDARRIYNTGKVDTRRGGMWVHRFLP